MLNQKGGDIRLYGDKRNQGTIFTNHKWKRRGRVFLSWGGFENDSKLTDGRKYRD